ncbi:MAG: Na+-transporting NADH:ubiquinone oxidoreductase subunit A [Candidatus Azotimanducaceae bacterium]|jgi:Na+-transporting NADH:ubiquinone oxidoreductase subunit A
MIKTKRGLNLPIGGSPEQAIGESHATRTVALLGPDYPGLKPTMEVAEGDQVKRGQLLFTDKKNPGINFTSPATGEVIAINRGSKRAFQSVVIELKEADSSNGGEIKFDVSENMDREQIKKLLIDSGEWAAFRNRPYNKVPGIADTPANIFVTAMDTRPLAANPSIVINENADAYLAGLELVATLTDGNVFVCSAPGADLPISGNTSVQQETFSGPHPSGLVGTHIHFLSPVSAQKSVWHIGYQDLIALGHLAKTGSIYTERVISLAGPGVEKPRLIRSRRGASIDEITAGELHSDEQRIISGSVFDGNTAFGPTAYLGRFHNQISVLPEGTDRQFLGFVMPGINKFSLTRLFAGSFLGAKNLKMTTNRGGSERAMVPLGTYEEVMPLDILPTQLLRALLVDDVDSAIQLGCLELDEEDLALCTFACPGKYEYGPYLREMLTRIEAEG